MGVSPSLGTIGYARYRQGTGGCIGRVSDRIPCHGNAQSGDAQSGDTFASDPAAGMRVLIFQPELAISNIQPDRQSQSAGWAST